MDLKNLVSPKVKSVEKYWSVIIEPDWVQTGVWMVRDGKVEVLSSSKPLPWGEEENLTDVIDSSLSVSVSNLPEDDLEISKTVFGLTSFWISSDGQIKPEYQSLIKNICQELSLKPVGFVGLNDALAFYLKSKEGTPFNGILVGLGGKNLSIALFVEGANKAETTVSRSFSVTDDVVEGLSRFSYSDSFPPRITLYDGREGEIDDVLQELVSVDWSKFEGINFLHIPRVESIAFEEKIKAVSLAGGVEILGATSVLLDEVEESNALMVDAKVMETDVVEGYSEEKKLEGDNFSPVDQEKLGFVVDKDIQEIGEKVIGKQIAQKGTNSLLDRPEPAKDGPLVMKEKNRKVRLLLDFVSMGFASFFSRNKVMLLSGILLLFLFLAVFLIAWWFLPKAFVVVYLSPKKIESKQNVVLDTKAESINFESRIIPANLIKKDITGEKTIPTSGTKLTGERARGKIVIYRTGPELLLKGGTKAQSTNGLTFVLDDDVVVASGSASSPSKTEARVTAADIGSEYNLAAGESFSISNYAISEIEAKNEESFSGGSSREVNAVSAADYEKLFTELRKELLDRAISEIKESLSEQDYFVAETISEKEKQKNYDHKIGDEAANLKLNLSFEFSAFYFKKSDMFELSKEVLKDQITSGYILREGQLSLSFDVENKGEDKATVLISFSANLLPAIDTTEIKNKIAGRNIKLVKEYLINESGYDKVQVDIVPVFFEKFMIMPRLTKNIEVQFEASR